MFARIADAALANRVVVILLVVSLVVVGGASLQKLPIDAQPDISPRQVLVVTQAPGLGPLDIERFITAPLELALQGMPHMENLRSVSRYGLSVIYVRFADDVDIYAARNLVSSRLPQVPLPAEASAPQMGPISTGLGEIYQFEVRGAQRSSTGRSPRVCGRCPA
jgi:cobalt-zinc-cadmium resistance protein CzcA